MAVTNANARRTVMPEEEVFTGRSSASPSSENATMADSRRAIAAWLMPIRLPPKYRLSPPLNSGSNPAPHPKKAAPPPRALDAAGAGLQGARQQLQQRALARPIVTHHAQTLPTAQFKRTIAQGPVAVMPGPAAKQRLEALTGRGIEAILLGQALHPQHHIANTIATAIAIAIARTAHNQSTS